MALVWGINVYIMKLTTVQGAETDEKMDDKPQRIP